MVARFSDASIYRDTFPAIRIAIVFFTITILFVFSIFLLFNFFNFLVFHNDFHFGRKETIISTCDFCKVIPQIHSYFVKVICEISVETN